VRHRLPVSAAVAVLALTVLSPATAPAQPAAAETLRVDLGARTGAFHGGATGILYGLGDPGVPSRDLIAGMRPRTISQKAPDGDQHPNGDALVVADDFFASGGTDVHIYAQDVYSKWPYQDLGIDDYVAKLQPQLDKVAKRPDRDRFVWTIFNEPDGIWYSDWATKKDKFLADWTRVYRLVKSVLPARLPHLRQGEQRTARHHHLARTRPRLAGLLPRPLHELPRHRTVTRHHAEADHHQRVLQQTRHLGARPDDPVDHHA
jgi:hypothetical protein